MREATREAHDALDTQMRETGWRDCASYGRFLQIQHAARLPLEAWAEKACSPDISPPKQTHLIERDLEALDIAPLARFEPFALPDSANPIGFAWAIAGSSLGNRAILRDIDLHVGTAMPTAFLADPGMIAFWKSLRPALERPASESDASAAALAATCVFDHFRKTTSALAPLKDAA